MWKICLTLFAAMLPFTLLAADSEYHPVDSTAINLEEVVVSASRPASDIIPVQTLSGEQLRKLNSNTVADALRYFSGVQIKDYGGVGGIKTVNVRSMGTNHTGVVYDGIALGNAQNGQIDLGQFSLDNIEAISLHNGQRSRILQPARDFGSAASVYMRTRTPDFEDGETYHARAAVRFGSFDLLNPSALIELKITDRLNASLSAEWLTSSGKYKFRYRRVNPGGEVAYDTTAVRQNGDIEATRIELNLNGQLRSGEWHLKGYTYHSERGVPGAIVNNVWRRGERIWDANSFVQGRHRQSFGIWTTLNQIKYAYYRTHYVNNDDRQLQVDNLYRQREFYFSTANEFSIIDCLSASVSYDLQWNTLNADVSGFDRPDRLTDMLSAAASLDLDRFKAQASALGTFIHDKLRGQQSATDRSVFTPGLYLSAYPLRARWLSLRAFAKRSFRMPTFNDLYYADVGNSKLNPEHVTQYNFGLVMERSARRGLWRAATLSVDAYYNRVKDKIVAYPKGQQFRWTMLNLGRVDIRGVDVSALSTFAPIRDLSVTLRAQYTFQRAIDVTDPRDSYYRDQIPYIPRHSGSAVLNLDWRGWNLNYSFIYVGERYNQQENIIYNYTQPWYTSDLSLGYDFKLRRVKVRALAEVNNLLSQDYDVILNYPMPKRNYRFSLTFEI